MFTGMLDAIHRAAPAEVWRRGVALVRRGAARVLECSPAGWRLGVDVDGRTLALTWAWGSWRCDCGAALCEHMVAAACTLNAAGELLDRAPDLLGTSARTARREAVTTELDAPLADNPRALVRDTLRRIELPAWSPGAAPAPAPGAAASGPPPAPPSLQEQEQEQEDQVLLPEGVQLAPRWQASESGFDVTFAGESSDGQRLELSAERVVQAWQSGSYAVEGLDGGLAWLPQDWLERHGPILEQFVAARNASSGELPRWARPAAAALCQTLDAPPPPELAGLATLVDGFTSVPPATLPAGLQAVLRDYQRQGVDWLCLLRDAGIGALLADDMGLGKTLQTLCAITGRTLVIAPTSTLPNWAAELARFRPDLRVSLYHGPKRSLDAAADVTLTSYAVLRLDREALAAHTWDTLVLDEAQAIKEPTTATAAAAFSLPARWRVAMSGTPVENRLTELWSLSHFCNPGLLGGRKDFITRHARRIEAGQPRAAAELQAKIRPFMLRRRKSEVARELPARTDLILRCTLDPQERAVYDSLRLATHAELASRLAAGLDTIEALELLLRLRQAACHLALVPGQQATRSSKQDLLLEHLTEHTGAGHRALVFSQWTSLLDLVGAALEAAGLPYVRLDGSTVDRGDVVARFQAQDGPPVMLVSLRAGGTGLNLTAADYVYLLDPWWNPAVEDQAADRSHRIGQERPVFVHRVVAEHTVEEKILELHARKRALADAAIEGVNGTALTREDLLELLQ